MTIDGKSVTLGGIEGFVQRARQLQERSVMTCEFEIRATGCNWEQGELAALIPCILIRYQSQTFGIYALILAY